VTKMRLLVLDDEKVARDFVAGVATHEGFEVETSATAEDFYEQLGSFRPDAIVLDIVMPNVDGNQVLMELGSQGVTAPVLLITAYDETVLSRATAIAHASGVEIAGTLNKPMSVDEMSSALDELKEMTAKT